ncbi:MAG: DUF3489 domain-containing protein [Beijerinckiaceae bacterium]|nr:DUF3489 domain-containing protein [Beijerinckiaceae bacterium]MCZ8298990.1 DUF3489 domain-containing protein [Beijerinckiaceae bacterium]
MPIPHNPKLTDAQLVILSRAARRADSRIVLPDHLRGAAAEQILASLLKSGLIQQVESDPPQGFSERPSGPCHAITALGLRAIGLDPTDSEGADRSDPKSDLTARAAALDAGRETRDSARLSNSPKMDKPPTKQSAILAMLREEGGATIDRIMLATSWQAHTIRAVMSGFRKRGLGVERVQDPAGMSRYRIVDFAEVEAGNVASSAQTE